MNSLDERIQDGIRRYQTNNTPVDEEAFLNSVFRRVAERRRHHERLMRSLIISLIVLVVAGSGVLWGSLISRPSTHATPTHEHAPPLHDPRAGGGGFTVAPSTNLTNGQRVVIRVHGLSPRESLLILMCRGVPTSFGTARKQCDLDTAMSVSTTTGGSARIDFTVRRFLTDGLSGQIDCATYAQGCSIGLGDFFDLTQGGTTGNVQPVSFAPGPAGPSTITSITTDPGAPFTDGETIAIVGRGFPPNVPLNVAQCPYNAECSPLFATVESSSSGTFSATLVVEQTLEISGQVFNCSQPNACYLLAQTTQQMPGSQTTTAVAPRLPITVEAPAGRK